MIQEIPVLLVCDDESLTLHEYMRLCERVYLELHGQNLGTRCFRIMEKKRYPSVDKSYVAAAQSLLKLDIHFKHMQWEYSHVRYRIIRRFNDDWRLMEPRLFDECAHIGVLGLRKYGTEMVSDDCNFRKPVSRRDALQSSQITKVICFNETCDLQPRIALFFWDIYRAILLETLTKTMDFQPLRNLKFRPGVVSGK